MLLRARAPVASMDWRLVLGVSLTAEYRAVPWALWGCGPVARKNDPSVGGREVGVAWMFLPPSHLVLSAPSGSSISWSADHRQCPVSPVSG